ncbi:hypothetical protein F4780DRAFT_768093 [Xylariomycetidae sp. FL0641]|nr:hypothetical protein F4780DRAFT_768093 [Xylariomycetidae sp. FL0641]
MTSIVADFFVNPVLRQARQLSYSQSSAAPSTSEPASPPPAVHVRRPSPQENALTGPSEASSLELNGVVLSNPASAASLSSPFRLSALDNRTGARQINGQSDIIFTRSDRYTESPSTEPPRQPREPTMALPSDSRRRLSLPEDDGNGTLRKEILAVQAQDIDPSQKARLMHQLLIAGYTKSQSAIQTERSLSPSSPVASEQGPTSSQGPLDSFRSWNIILDEAQISPEAFHLTAEDLAPTYAPKESSPDFHENIGDTELSDERPLGCEHYRRNVKMQCSTCHRWYTCRFCHDKVEDHALVRKDTKNMLCMLCGMPQPAGEACVGCGASAARYYCAICKLWNDDPDKPCYHCNDCGICRIGRGLGKDFFHCKKCCACISISMESDHKCIERATDCDCPICGDYMFTSPKAVCFMKCGHSIHRQCFDLHMRSSYKCPICNKSLANMESQFRNLDLAIEAQPMPPEFRDTRAIVLCNDCSAKSSTAYHWLGLKCSVCLSYNTAQLQITGVDESDLQGVASTQNVRLPEWAAPPGSSNPGNVAQVTSRDMRRRHSSNLTSPQEIQRLTNADSTERLARSVSPVPTPVHTLHPSISENSVAEDEEEEEDRDMIGIRSWIPRSIASNDDDDEEAESTDDESVLSTDEEIDDEEEDGEESDEDEFELLGHR